MVVLSRIRKRVRCHSMSVYSISKFLQCTDILLLFITVKTRVECNTLDHFVGYQFARKRKPRIPTSQELERIAEK